MRQLATSPYQVMKQIQLLGLAEIPGDKSHPLIQYAFSLCGNGLETPDSVPWCSAILQIPFAFLGLNRSASARARSWLLQGDRVDIEAAERGFDVVVLKRGAGPQPGRDVVEAPGHVGLYHGHGGGQVWLLGGNQADKLSVGVFMLSDLLAVQRIES